jgi:hypothetical protein
MGKTGGLRAKIAPLLSAFVVALFFSEWSFSQEQPARLLIKVDQTSSEPFAGERESSCLRLYSNGRIVYSNWSTSAFSLWT